VSRADNTAHLRRAAAARHDATTIRARAAITELDRSGAPVTVAGVATAARVSRSWLYDQPELIAAITHLRERAVTGADATPVPGAQRASDESLRQRLQIAKVEIERLRSENTSLRDQLARALGEQRTRR
jgi:hypothetical protein